MPAFEGCSVVRVEARVSPEASGFPKFIGEPSEDGRSVVPDASRWTKLRLIRLFFIVGFLVFKHRPSCIVSTGAAAGLFALMFGKLIRAKTIWLDSIANIDELSMSGRLVRPFADLWLTQHEHLAGPNGPQFCGKVL